MTNLNMTVADEAIINLMGAALPGGGGQVVSDVLADGSTKINYNLRIPSYGQEPDIDLWRGELEIEDGDGVTGWFYGTQKRTELEHLFGVNLTFSGPYWATQSDVDGEDIFFSTLTWDRPIEWADFYNVSYSTLNFDRITEGLDFNGVSTTITIEEVEDGANIWLSGSNVTATIEDDGDADIDASHVDNATINGGDGNDTIEGGGEADALFGYDGFDYIRGGDGDDTIEGGADSDALYGDNDNDNLLGGDGNDVLNGGAGDDNLGGGAGDDYLVGGAGDDYLNGGQGEDFVFVIVGNGDQNTIITDGDGADADHVIISNLGAEGNISLHLGEGDQAVGITTNGLELDLDRFLDAGGIQIGETTFDDDIVGGKG